MKDTDDLDRDQLYKLCVGIYREARDDSPNLDTILEDLEGAGFSRFDLED